MTLSRQQANRAFEKATASKIDSPEVIALREEIAAYKIKLARWRAAVQNMLNDFQTSETHHPEHVLVRTKDFDAIAFEDEVEDLSALSQPVR